MDAKTQNNDQLLQTAIDVWFNPALEQVWSDDGRTVAIDAEWWADFVDAWYAYLKATGKAFEEAS